MVLHARANGNPGEVVQRIREEVAAVDPTAPMFDVHTLQEEMNAALVQQRLIALLSSLFGALALVLACVGLYGLLTFTVVQCLLLGTVAPVAAYLPARRASRIDPMLVLRAE